MAHTRTTHASLTKENDWFAHNYDRQRNERYDDGLLSRDVADDITAMAGRSG
jgi:hypothetical protein